MSWTARLIDSWKRDGVPITEGASEAELLAFEREHQVKFPEPFREYLVAVNGMAKPDCDGRLFAFWPLALIRPVLAEYPAYGDRARDCFMFADFMIRSLEYAIDLNAESKQAGSVTLVGGADPQLLSRSFPEFIELYLRDATELYGSKK